MPRPKKPRVQWRADGDAVARWLATLDRPTYAMVRRFALLVALDARASCDCQTSEEDAQDAFAVLAEDLRNGAKRTGAALPHEPHALAALAHVPVR